MKRIVLLLLITFIVNVGAWAADFFEFEFGGIRYTITSSSDLTVDVTSRYNEYSGDVVIPSSVTYEGTTYSVTSIGERAFSGCSGLTSVVIPSSVTGIGSYAFSGCSSLTSVVIPSSVTGIGRSAFSGCSGLTSVVIPSSVTSIGERAFSGCSGLTSVVIPSSVTSIGWDAFSNVTRIDYTGSLEEWCNKQWDPTCISHSYDLYINGKKVEEVKIPSSVTGIGWSAFSGCSGLTSVVIPSSVTGIGWSAFSGCSGLTSVEIPSSVTSIGGFAFSGCSGLTSVVIPSSVTWIEYTAFYGCDNLKYNEYDNGLYLGNSENPYLYLEKAKSNEITSVTINGKTSVIASNAFYGCSSLTSVVIPSGVTEIGERAFYDCGSLTSVVIPSSVTSIGYEAFYGCDKIRTMVIGSGLEELPKGILDNPIKSLTLYGMTPYSVSGYSSTSLPGCYANCEVYVPEEAYEAYYYDGFWGYFNLQVIGDPTINVVGNKGGTVGRVSYENNVLTLSVTPDDGNVVDKIYVDNTVVYGSVNKWAPVMDVFVVVNNDGTIDIHNVTKENVVSVSFKKSVEVPTSIAEIISGEQEALEIYDLQGRKLSKPQKGINIIDGKKVIVK